LKDYLVRETVDKKLIEIDKDGNHNLKNDFENEIQKKIKEIIFNFDKFETGDILLLNFNYTKTAELYTEGKAKIIYIHGELDPKKNNHIIFGYGDEKSDESFEIEKLEENEFLKNVKSLQYNKTHNYTDLEIFLTQPYEVFVFGHSCANCDRTLLNMLFDNEKNCKSVRIFYNGKDAEKSFANVNANIYRQFNAETKYRFRKVVECEIDSIPLPNKITKETQPYILDYFLEKVQIPNDNFEYTLIENNEKRTIKKSFYISKFQITQKQYENLMGKNPSYFKGEDFPVETVSWYDVVEFCNQLSGKNNLTKYYEIKGKDVTFNESANGYRLPTDAEWEYAARGGNLSFDDKEKPSLTKNRNCGN
jgi:hypothetical protein